MINQMVHTLLVKKTPAVRTYMSLEEKDVFSTSLYD